MDKTRQQDNLLKNANLAVFEQAVSFALRDKSAIQPNTKLSGLILDAIDKKKRFYILLKMIILSITSVMSFVALFLVWQTEGAVIIHSEAGQLLSLLFSDFRIVLGMWREYLVSLAESLPIVSIVLVAVFAWSLSASLWAITRVSKKFVNSAFKHA
jgi:hypothetical protein